MHRPTRHAPAGPARASFALVLAAATALIAGASLGWLAGIGTDAGAPTASAEGAGTAAPSATATPEPTATATTESVPAPSPTPIAAVAQDVTFSLVAGGDILTHTPVNASAETDDSYDYTALMDGLVPYLQGADLAICHLEVPVSPEGVRPSGYPIFSAPSALVRDLATMGWDGCSTASNHSVDKGSAGVEATLAAFDDQLLQHAGTARTEDESEAISYYVVQDGDRTVRVAHLSWSYGTNGMPEAAAWEVDTFDADAADASPIIEAAQRARDDGADVVVASVHCCVEYRTEPSAAQRSIATQIAESGLVDLYIGHHAHVPQPVELLPGGPSGDGMWTAFGLGNLLSNQDASCCTAATSNGVLLDATFTVTPDGDVSVDAGWIATTVDRRGGHTVHALADIADGSGTLTAAEVATRHAAVRDAVGDEATEITAPRTGLAQHAYALLRPAPSA
ncbi:CapA family protein [Demequina mangrovi]|uniref:Poly-gamma-glutamate synthesis protein (Capsule biosynthesis protein) n=1 Tax=Demequina mangrovi TaxID=1043493 RepID=A0A1H6ZFY2_9MICO|nr:CapA family protein [Demequina mangrovi]SEJ47755.1 poly-gamma-glutamate synthesis protein (capsule biosynthesis protein) [Demequina mangrovi]